MTGLVLKLAPNERVLINGAVIENGERRTRISIKTPHTHILRLRDAIHPDDATTPVRRACYQAQLILSGDRSVEDGRKIMLVELEQLSQVFNDHDSRSLLSYSTQSVLDNNFYQVLKSLRNLLPREARIIGSRT